MKVNRGKFEFGVREKTLSFLVFEVAAQLEINVQVRTDTVGTDPASPKENFAYLADLA